MEENQKKDAKTWVKIVIVIAVLIIVFIAGGVFMNNGNNGTNKENKGLFASKEDNVKIVESEAKTIKLTDYNNGLFTMKIPEGWKVDTLGDNIHYTIKVYNPEKPIY